MADIPYQAPAPDEEDLRTDSAEFDPAIEPQSSKAWLNLLQESEDAFCDWNDRCDNIDQRYGNISRLNDPRKAKQFQLYWANIEVLKPAVYARTPVPVVVEKFKDRRPVYKEAGQLLERCATVAFDIGCVNRVLMDVRDDLAICGRGVVWCRYEKGNGGYYDHEKVCYDFKHRKDFLHSLSRTWEEVTWVAAASYLTRSEARERFSKYSGDCYQDAEYTADKDSQEVGGADARERAKFWEIWNKGEKRVVWVAKGCDEILDESDPHLKLSYFFPCPRPAYGCLQRGSLVPVPDILQYKDQLDEIDTITGRIHALSERIVVKGFYPSGGKETAEAIQTALAINTPDQVLVPVSNWAAFGGSKEIISWFPVEQVAEVVTALIALRKQLIEDVYQIMGLSDIMRGATDPQETLGAQQLKTEYGSSRIRDKQRAMAEVARDLVCITSDILLEKFDPVTLIQMSQTQLPTQQLQAQKIAGMQADLVRAQQTIQQMQQNPQVQQAAQANPDQMQQTQQQAQAMLAQKQQELNEVMAEPTLDQVMVFLKNAKARSFTLDIETDSTIVADEDAEKQRRTEFLGMLAPLLQQLATMIAATPETTEFCGSVLKFAVAPFRTERALGTAIDNLVAMMEAKGSQPRVDDPTTASNKAAIQIAQIKAQQESERDKMQAQLKAQEIAMRHAQEQAKIASNEKLKLIELGAQQRDDMAKAVQANQKTMAERERAQVDLVKGQQELAANRQKAAMQFAAHQAKMGDIAARADERRAAQQFRSPSRPLGF